MLYNKNRFKKVNDKRILHKIKKHWITISITILSMVGGGAVTTTTSANTTNQNSSNNNINQANHFLSINQNNCNNQDNHSFLNQIHNNQSNQTNYNNINSNNINSQIMQNAKQLHNQIIKNILNQNKNNHHNLDYTPPKPASLWRNTIIYGAGTNNPSEPFEFAVAENMKEYSFGYNYPPDGFTKGTGGDAEFDLKNYFPGYSEYTGNNLSDCLPPSVMYFVNRVPAGYSLTNNGVSDGNTVTIQNPADPGEHENSDYGNISWNMIKHGHPVNSDTPIDGYFIIKYINTDNGNQVGKSHKIYTNALSDYNDTYYGSTTNLWSDKSLLLPACVQDYIDNIPNGYTFDPPVSINMKKFFNGNPNLEYDIPVQPDPHKDSQGTIVIRYIDSSDNHVVSTPLAISNDVGKPFNLKECLSKYSDYLNFDFSYSVYNNKNVNLNLGKYYLPATWPIKTNITKFSQGTHYINIKLAKIQYANDIDNDSDKVSDYNSEINSDIDKLNKTSPIYPKINHYKDIINNIFPILHKYSQQQDYYKSYATSANSMTSSASVAFNNATSTISSFSMSQSLSYTSSVANQASLYKTSLDSQFNLDKSQIYSINNKIHNYLDNSNIYNDKQLNESTISSYINLSKYLTVNAISNIANDLSNPNISKATNATKITKETLNKEQTILPSAKSIYSEAASYASSASLSQSTSKRNSISILKSISNDNQMLSADSSETEMDDTKLDSCNNYTLMGDFTKNKINLYSIFNSIKSLNSCLPLNINIENEYNSYTNTANSLVADSRLLLNESINSSTSSNGNNNHSNSSIKPVIPSNSDSSTSSSSNSTISNSIASIESTIRDDYNNEFSDGTKELNDLKEDIQVYDSVCDDYNNMTIYPSFFPSDLDILAKQNDNLITNEHNTEQDYVKNSNAIFLLNHQLNSLQSTSSILQISNPFTSRPRALLGNIPKSNIKGVNNSNSNVINITSNATNNATNTSLKGNVTSNITSTANSTNNDPNVSVIKSYTANNNIESKSHPTSTNTSCSGEFISNSVREPVSASRYNSYNFKPSRIRTFKSINNSNPRVNNLSNINNQTNQNKLGVNQGVEVSIFSNSNKRNTNLYNYSGNDNNKLQRPNETPSSNRELSRILLMLKTSLRNLSSYINKHHNNN